MYKRQIFISLLQWLSAIGRLPDVLTDGDTNHTTVLLSNLGSIKCDCCYHHLNNYGTNSIMITVGVIHKAVSYTHLDVYKRQARCKYNGVNIMLNTEATREMVTSMKPDAVICAVGSHPFVPPIKGVENASHARCV